MLKPPIKERVEDIGSNLSEIQVQAVRELANDLHRLNNSVIRCVEAGLSLELQRTARHHAAGGCWGDLLVPIIVKQRG
jgi:hypothetical protein